MIWRLLLVLTLSLVHAPSVLAQHPPGQQGSPNLEILSHLPLVGDSFSHADIEVEQELARPYAYVTQRAQPAGFQIINLKDPTDAKVLYHWTIENPELHQGGAVDNKYFKVRGRYYDVTSFQFRRGGPDADLGAVVFDVTGLPDTSAIEEVGRLRATDTPGGFHNIFAYKHSDGRVLLFTTTSGPHANVYDMTLFLSGDASQGLVGRVPVPDNPLSPQQGYHDFFVGYDPSTRQDKFYGAGSAGAHVYDVTQPESPRLLTSVTGVAGVRNAHTFTPTPDGRYALLMALPTYQHSPVRVFDLKPGLEGSARAVSRPIGAWIAKWNGASHNHEVRWPYVFVSAQDDALQVLNIMDPTNPYTVAYYDTKEGPELGGLFLGGSVGDGGGIYDGVWGVDVRNADGLIVVSDLRSGFWAFRMDGFAGWNGHQWGVPNISSAQDWDDGPDGAPAPARISTRS